MLCPNCKFDNGANAQACLICGTTLEQAHEPLMLAAPNPFEGFVPAWLQTATETPQTADANSNVSIEDLLNSSTEFAVPPPPFHQIAQVPLSIAALTSPHTPRAEFSEPTYNIAAPEATFSSFETEPEEYYDADQHTPADLPHSYYAPTPSISPPLGNGLYKGCYYFSDALGGTVVMQIASLQRRFWGAVLDSFFVVVFSFVFWIVASIVLAIIIVGTGSVQTGQALNSTADSNSPDLMLTLVAFLAANALPFLYHVSQVSLSGQTLGHRISGIRVMRSSGFKVGLVPSMIRALWGIAYGLVTSVIFYLALNIITPIFYANDLNNLNTASDPTALLLQTYQHILGSVVITLGTVEGLAALLVLWVMLSNPGRQGMHDKLADTYVVRFVPVTVFGRDFY